MGYAGIMEPVLEGTFHFFHLRQVIDDDMGGQGYVRGAYGPDMEMMDICDARPRTYEMITGSHLYKEHVFLALHSISPSH